MTIPIYQVDAFTSEVFKGNPAAVCPLESWPSAATLQAIAAENNLAETAFFVPGPDRYHLRWFTPTVEVDLCGHATLAAAFVIFERLGHPSPEIEFDSLGGLLRVTRQDGRLYLDFPARPPKMPLSIDGLAAALGAQPREVGASRDILALFDQEEDVRALSPDMARLAALDQAVIATAPGQDCDFVSRFFAPNFGIPEDPVTGSSHCTLIPYWAQRLGKTTLHARQVSQRGGELFCEAHGERVSIGGHAVFYLEGTIRWPE
ncbi:MAG: PhzF family phenazine biosynthesis protein [Vicinamibacteria bacterium]|jgi:PhzF family phenazine biosynthesis protein|nr:PhzF family phenazine biosynthesis protein [Vicinamibacteria bacterium]